MGETNVPQENSPIFRLGPNSNGQVFFLFGARHSNNADDSQFEVLKTLWFDFTKNSNPNKTVFVEGQVRQIPESFESAIQQRGEVGATQWLAQESNILVECPEPDNLEQRNMLLKSFNPADIAYTFIVQSLSSWSRQIKPNFSFEQAMNNSLEREQKFQNIYGFTPDLDWLIKYQRLSFPGQEIHTPEFLNKISDPRRSDTHINQIVAARTKLRNEYIISRVKDAWNSGASIFMVYGQGHVKALETAIRPLVN